MNRLFRGGGAGPNVGTGFAGGAQDLVQNFVGMMDLGNRAQSANLASRRQAMDEGALQAQRSPAVLISNSGGQGPGGIGMPTSVGPEDEAPVGAQALATTPQPVQGPPSPYDVKNLSTDDLRSLAFDRGQEAKGAALGNQNDLESLQKAYHYKTVMKAFAPEMDRWAAALMKVGKDPKDLRLYRDVQVLTGQEDPKAAESMARQEYLKLKEKYEGYAKQYGPLDTYLSKRGITGDMYDDEAKFIQFMNEKQFIPHTPAAARVPMRSNPR